MTDSNTTNNLSLLNTQQSPILVNIVFDDIKQYTNYFKQQLQNSHRQRRRQHCDDRNWPAILKTSPTIVVATTDKGVIYIEIIGICQ